MPAGAAGLLNRDFQAAVRKCFDRSMEGARDQVAEAPEVVPGAVNTQARMLDKVCSPHTQSQNPQGTRSIYDAFWPTSCLHGAMFDTAPTWRTLSHRLPL